MSFILLVSSKVFQSPAAETKLEAAFSCTYSDMTRYDSRKLYNSSICFNHHPAIQTPFSALPLLYPRIFTNATPGFANQLPVMFFVVDYIVPG